MEKMIDKKDKKDKKKIAMIIIFILGFAIFLYPAVSNIVNSAAQNKAIYNYKKELKKMTKEEKKKEIEEARKYNESLINTNIKVKDPYGDDKETPDKEEKNEVKYISPLDVKNIIGNIEIPRIGLKISIYKGTSELVLQKGAGHMEGSSLPIGGIGSHTALTAHRGLASFRLFRDLDKLKMGDEFYIHNIKGTIAYKVEDIKIVLPDETENLEIDSSRDYATLVTCEPYMINTHRLLVRGSRVAYNPSSKDPKAKEKTNLFYKYRYHIFLIIILLLSLIVYRKNKSSINKKEKIR